MRGGVRVGLGCGDGEGGDVNVDVPALQGLLCAGAAGAVPCVSTDEFEEEDEWAQE